MHQHAEGFTETATTLRRLSVAIKGTERKREIARWSEQNLFS